MKSLIAIIIKFLTFQALLFCLFPLHSQNTGEPIYRFSENGKECIVTNSHLPRPWLNRLSNDIFFTWITHNGYIESFLLDPQINGLVNPQEASGHFFIRDNDSEKYFLLNESDEDSEWRGVVGLGYNKLIKEKDQIKGELTYFIPGGDNVLIILASVTNVSDRPRNLSLFGQVEWNLGDRMKTTAYKTDGLGGTQHNLYKRVFFENNVLYAQQNNWRNTGTCIPWPYMGYFTSSEIIKSFETNQLLFTGLMGDFKSPEAIQQRTCSNNEFWSYDEYPLGVLQTEFSLSPQETKDVVFLLGMEREAEAINKVLEKYNSPDKARKALESVTEYYSELVDQTVSIKTPDSENDRIINIWTKYQWRQGWKRDLDGLGFGNGFWAYNIESGGLGMFAEYSLLPLDMDIIRSSVINSILRRQVSTSDGTQLFFDSKSMLDSDLGEEGVLPDLKGHFEIPHRHNINRLFNIYYYLTETGEEDFLHKEVPFIDGANGTVMDHIKVGLDIAVKVLNERGLARIPTGVGDWMDEFTKISRSNNAESIMLSCELAFLLKEFAEIARTAAKPELADHWMSYYEKIREGVNQFGWDEDWYMRAISDREGSPKVGIKDNEEGKIYLNAQSWPILSGIASGERVTKALNSVEKYLSSDYGPMILWPPYSSYVNYVGTQSLYAPGFRNGNIYLRPTGWAIIAESLGGRADLAYATYQSASLASRGQSMDSYLLEPYAYPEGYVGPDHQRGGEGQFHWCYGEGAAWMWYAYVNYILGVRAEWDGLRVDPKIPAEWKEYTVRRPFRGSVYEITVKNPENVSSGIRWIKIDGKQIKGNLIIPMKKAKIYQVEVMMGTNSKQ